MKSHVCAIALGSNLGDRAHALGSAVEHLSMVPGVRLITRSRWIETTAEGGPPGQGPYLNGVVLIDTALPAQALLGALLAIERAHGRVRDVPNAPRTLDLDLLTYGDERIDEPGLHVPHPRLTRRLFVLEPLAEVAPELVIAGTGSSVSVHLERLRQAGTPSASA
jgi:2-amino-4-hydroxy-6-hydroxymethyldihydropteridine diphosphokinase